MTDRKTFGIRVRFIAAAVSGVLAISCNGSFKASLSSGGLFTSGNSPKPATGGGGGAPSTSSAPSGPPPTASGRIETGSPTATRPASADGQPPAAPSSSPSDAAFSVCDIRTTDWKNFKYGKDQLKDGYKSANVRPSPNEPPLDGYGLQLFQDDITYADINGDSKIEAYVPVGDCSPENCYKTIWVFEADAPCRPRFITKLNAGGGGDSGKASGDRYVYLRQINPNLDKKERVEVQYVKGRFSEVKVTVVSTPD